MRGKPFRRQTQQARSRLGRPGDARGGDVVTPILIRMTSSAPWGCTGSGSGGDPEEREKLGPVVSSNASGTTFRALPAGSPAAR